MQWCCACAGCSVLAAPSVRRVSLVTTSSWRLSHTSSTSSVSAAPSAHVSSSPATSLQCAKTRGSSAKPTTKPPTSPTTTLSTRLSMTSSFRVPATTTMTLTRKPVSSKQFQPRYVRRVCLDQSNCRLHQRALKEFRRPQRWHLVNINKARWCWEA